MMTLCELNVNDVFIFIFYCNLWIAKEPRVRAGGNRSMPRQAKERQKEGTKRKRTVPVLDTQSSLKLIAETAVSEDSHHGGPVLGGGGRRWTGGRSLIARQRETER